MAKRVKTKKGSIGKKALAAILAASMVLSSSAFSVFAAAAEPNAYQGKITVKYDQATPVGGTNFSVSPSENGELTFTDPDFNAYDGTQKKPDAFQIAEEDGDVIAKKNYEITYGENKNAGTGTVNITFKQNRDPDETNYQYLTPLHYTFEIKGMTLDSSKASIEVGEPNHKEYTGKKVTPNVKVKLRVKVGDSEAGTELKEGTDYELCDVSTGKTLNMVAADNYAISVKGLGNYSGSNTAQVIYGDNSFTVDKAELSDSKVSIETTKVLNKSGNVQVGVAEAAIKVTDVASGDILTEDTANYDIEWKNAAGEYVAFTNAFSSGITQAGTYDFQIVPSGNKEGNFDRGSAKGSIEVVDQMNLQQLIDNYGKDKNGVLEKVDGAYQLKSGGEYTGSDVWSASLKTAVNNMVGNAEFAGSDGLCELPAQELEMINAGEYDVNLKSSSTGETAKIKVRVKPTSININAEGETDRSGDVAVTAQGLKTGFSMNITEGTTRKGNVTEPVITIKHTTYKGTETYTLQKDKDYTYTTKSVGGKTVVMFKGMGNYTTKIDDAETFDVTITSRSKYLPLSSEIIKVTIHNVKYDKDENKMVVTGANVEVWDSEMNLKLTEGTDYVLDFTGNEIKDGSLVAKISKPNPVTYYDGEREIVIGIDGENDFTNVAYLDNIADYTMEGTTKIQVSDVKTLVWDSKLKYIDGNGLYDKVSDPLKHTTVITIKDEDGKEYTTDLEPGKLYTLEVRRNDGRFNGAVSTKFRVNGPNISDHVTIGKIADQNYTGSEITPAVTMTWDGNDNKGNSVSTNTKLVKDVDYTVSYFSNINVGIAKAVVTMKGKYSGTKEVYFNIVGAAGALVFADPAQKSLLENGVAVGAEDLALNIVPSAADDTLKLSYASDNTDVVTVTEAGVLSFKGEGTATVTVTATSNKANYEPLKVTVVVKKDGAPTEELVANCTPSRLKKVKKSFTVTTSTVKGADKWVIRYSLKNLNKTTKGSAKATFNDVNKVKQQVVKVNKSGAKYYVQCRVVKDGVKSAWSKVKTVKSR